MNNNLFSKSFTHSSNNQHNRKKSICKCYSKICGCPVWSCWILTALIGLMLIAAITAALTFTLITSNTTVMITTTTATTTTSTTISTTTSTTSATTTTTAPILLLNPGGEFGSLSPWIKSGGTSPMLDNGTANSGSTPPYQGSYAFYGGDGGGTLTQSVFLTNVFTTTQLDSGLLYASISFWEKSTSSSPIDTAEVSLVFLSATNTTISTVSTGVQSCVSAWCYVTGNWSLPSGTRTINYVMTFVANYGSYADAWIDSNTLDIS